jgi:hypothetical protein
MHDGNPGLLRVHDIDQHFFAYGFIYGLAHSGVQPFRRALPASVSKIL